MNNRLSALALAVFLAGGCSPDAEQNAVPSTGYSRTIKKAKDAEQQMQNRVEDMNRRMGETLGDPASDKPDTVSQER